MEQMSTVGAPLQPPLQFLPSILLPQAGTTQHSISVYGGNHGGEGDDWSVQGVWNYPPGLVYTVANAQ